MTGISEFDVIAKYLKPLAASAPGAFALSDDAAVLPDLPSGHAYVVTKDALAAGVHMRSDESPADMARKALRVNLSDLAAMGARPIGLFMALCLGADTDESFVQAFCTGLGADLKTFDVALMGGDIIRQPGPFIVSITAFGHAPRDRMLRRSGAQIGDTLWITGTIGDAALGLRAATGQLSGLKTADQEYLVDRYCIPQPRTKLGVRLIGLAHACIDVSDGLVADVGHICAGSALGCVIQSEKVPVSPAVRAVLAQNSDVLVDILTGGDDYELAFAAPERAAEQIRHLAAAASIQISSIGTFVSGHDVEVRDRNGDRIPIPSGGYRHV
jgi:thiamine-monophosphate kinase